MGENDNSLPELQEFEISKQKKWYKNIKPTVEPAMFFYMTAFMITSVVEQAFFLYQACIVNFGYSEEICINLEIYDDIKKEVQKTVSTFHQWNNVLGHIVPIILALFIGSWSDRRGRKLLLIIGLCGKLYYSVMIVIVTYQKTWPVEYIIYFATIPCALTGADVAIFAACYAYISDVSTITNRTLRVTILDISFLSTIPTGVAIGSYLFNNVLKKSYSYMFIINATMLVIAIIYSIIFLQWQTTSKQRPITELSPCNMIKDFFDKNHVIESIKTLTRDREEQRRLYLWMFMLSMTFYTFQRDENPMTYLYTQLKFNWDTKLYSDFKVFQSTAYVIAMLIGIPVMSKLFGFRDTSIVMVGATAHAIARIFFGFAETTTIFYIGGAISSLGPIVQPVLRSMTSKVVPLRERGKVFALLSVFNNAAPVFSGVLYSQTYNATIDIHPAAIFWLTLTTQVLVFLLVLVVHIRLGRKSLDAQEYEKPELIFEANLQRNDKTEEND